MASIEELVLSSNLKVRRRATYHDNRIHTIGSRPAPSEGILNFTRQYSYSETISSQQTLMNELKLQLGYQGTGIEFGLAVARVLGISTETGFSDSITVPVRGMSCFDIHVQVISNVEIVEAEIYKVEKKRRFIQFWLAEEEELGLGTVRLEKFTGHRTRKVLIYNIKSCPVQNDEGAVAANEYKPYALAEIGEYLICVPLRRDKRGGYLPFSHFHLDELDELGITAQAVKAKLDERLRTVADEKELLSTLTLLPR